jgi:hypothetical protein
VIEVAVVLVWGKEEVGLCRGAEEEEDANPKRAKSRLKLDNRERGGRGEEEFLVRAWKLSAKGSEEGSSSATTLCVLLSSDVVVSIIAWDRPPWADVVLLAPVVGTGAEE